MRTKFSTSELFWKKVSKDPETGCWNWFGAKTDFGHGKFWNGSKTTLAHRYSFLLHGKGPLTSDDVLMHSCDNPSCVNPYHLSIGTHETNVADRQAKGRTCQGRDHHFAILTKRQFDNLCRLVDSGYPAKFIAKKFSVSDRYVYKIKSKREEKSA